MVALGPGVLSIGTAPTLDDYSCLVNSLELTVDVTVGDSTFKLCGTEVPGTITPTGTLAGNVDQDIDTVDGLFEFCSKNWGTVQDFEFQPSTTAGLTASGKILITPLSFGGDEYGAPMSSDVSWQTVGDIAFDDGLAVPVRSWVQTMTPKQAPASGTLTAPQDVAAEDVVVETDEADAAV